MKRHVRKTVNSWQDRSTKWMRELCEMEWSSDFLSYGSRDWFEAVVRRLRNTWIVTVLRSWVMESGRWVSFTHVWVHRGDIVGEKLCDWELGNKTATITRQNMAFSDIINFNMCTLTYDKKHHAYDIPPGLSEHELIFSPPQLRLQLHSHSLLASKVVSGSCAVVIPMGSTCPHVLVTRKSSSVSFFFGVPSLRWVISWPSWLRFGLFAAISSFEFCGVALRLRVGSWVTIGRITPRVTCFAWYHDGRRGFRAGGGFAGIVMLS